jgi:6-pyruvoyltetrahydropterin/6-carboxytetrahydropterin synthase
MYTIIKQFSFEAAHHLYNLPPGHQCARQHGHSYRVEVELSSRRLNREGFVRDYGELDVFASFLKTTYDHRNLNEIDPYAREYGKESIQTSAENIAMVLFKFVHELFPETVAVRVSETQKTWAEYRP